MAARVVTEPSASRSDSPGQQLMSLLRPVRGQLVLAAVTSGASAVLGVASFVLIGQVLNELFAAEPGVTAVRWLLGATLVAVIARSVLRKLSFDISHVASFDLETRLRRDLTTHLSVIPLGTVQRLGSGTVKKVVQDDVRALHGAVADSVPMFGASLTQPVAALVALGIIDWRLLLATLVIVPLVVIGFRLTMADYETQRRDYDHANEAVNEAVVEFLQGMPVVRTFDDGTTSFRRFTTRVEDFTRATEAWQRKGLSSGVLTRAAMTPLPTLVIVLAVGTWLTVHGSMTPADLVIAAMIAALPIESVVPLMYMSDFINQSTAGAARIRQVLDIAPLPVAAVPRQPRGGSIAFRDVTFGYDGPDGRPALNQVTLDIPGATVCALVGASGAGKSTVARLIPRFWDVDAGQVLVGGADVRDIAPDVLLQHVGLVFQDPFLIDGTVAENIRLARPDATDEEVWQAAQAAMADEFIRTELPDGYQTVVGERGGLLSGGQRQRITIARALLADSPIIVLDEATAFADPENEAAIQDAIARLTAGRTVVVIAHRLSTIVTADQIVVMNAGRVAERGTHADLVAADGLYARMWRDHERAQAWGMSTSSLTAAKEETRL